MTVQALATGLPSPPAQGAVIEIVVHETIESVVPALRQLEADDHASLHDGADWCAAWLSTHPTKPLFLEGRIDGRTAFVLPLALSSRRGSWIARFVGSDYSNINTGLFDRSLSIDPEALRQALTKALKGRADLLSLERMALQWRERISPFAYLPLTENQNRAFQVPLHATFEETLKQVNAKRRRKKFRLQQRRLEEAGGYEIVEPQTASERHALLDEFFRQKAERFRTQGLPDAFGAPSVKAFFHALLDTPASPDRYMLRLYGLRLATGDRPFLAVIGTSRKGDHIICQFGSIREDLLPEASPGEFLFWHVIEAACRDGAAIFDFGIGDQAYKRSWCTIETIQYDVLLPLSLQGHLAAGLHRLLIRIKAAIKANPALYGAIQKRRSAASKGGDVADPAEAD